MGRVLRTHQANADLDGVWDYVARNDMAAADRLYQEIREAIELLVTAPDSGIRRDELRPGLLCKPVKQRYLVYYQVDGDDVRVLRILHGARDVEGLF